VWVLLMVLTGCSASSGHHPLLAAEAHYFFLDEKVTKDQVSRYASLPHLAFALQTM